MKPLSFRVRLAIWNALVLLAMFSLAGGGVWLAIRNSIHESVDEDLGERLVLLKGEVERALADAGEAGLPDRLARETATGQGARFRLSNGERWIYQSAGAERWPGLPTLPPALDANGLTQTLFVNDRPVRVLTARETFDGTPWLVEIGVPMGEFYSAFRHIAWALGLASPAVLIIAALGGYWMSVWALRPVGQVTQTARAIGAENLTERLPLLGTGDEIDRLSETLNDMFGRLDVAFRRVTQFTADASHELRTPTAIIRTTAEIARRRPRHHDEYEEALDRILVESERMTTLIDDLLLLARSDADRHEFVFESTSLGAVVRRACEQGRVLAEAAGVHFAYDVGVDPLTSGDPQALERLFLILLDNAVKYTPAGGHVSVAMRVADAAAIVDVSDTGVGIREDDVPLIFERFYRVDKDRSRARGGVGLGLAIAQRIAVAHGGLVTVRSVSGQGSTFSVHLPAVVPDERTTPHRNAH